MSKIQEALNKIESSRSSSSDGDGARSSHGRSDDSMAVATLVDPSLDGEHTFHPSGKSLQVDQDALRQAGLIAPDYHEEMLANQYRDIKRPLIRHAFGKGATQIEDGNLIMVSSALAGEGKTFTSINLALSMAHERDYSVLLVDADVAKPQTSQIFGASDEAGLLDALENPGHRIESLVLPTDANRLCILPAGKPRHHATELLASSAMKRIMMTLASLNTGQIVILDSPPLLQTSEAKVLAGLVGQIVLVVRAEATSQDAVLRALSTLDEDTAVNLVLNQARSGFRTSQYGYGYGYGYGDGYGQPKDEDSASLSDSNNNKE